MKVGRVAAPFSVEQANALYRIDLVDFGYERPGNWLLVSAGSGLMLSVMDCERRHRYCLDTDPMPKGCWRTLSDWLQMMERAVDRVNACGWFSRYENGLPLIGALAALEKRPLVYFGAYERPDLLNRFDVARDLGDFIDRLNALPSPALRRARSQARHDTGSAAAACAQIASENANSSRLPRSDPLRSGRHDRSSSE